MNRPIEIYQTQDGQTQVDVRFEQESVWLSIDDMVHLFQKSRSTVNEHILNIYKEKELEEETSMRKIGISDFSTKPTNLYNLDVIISVGYRVRSKQGTQFRIWATARLKDYLFKGYALNQKRLQQNAAELEQALALIQKTAASPELTLESGRGLVDIVSRYTQTFFVVAGINMM